MQYAVNRNLKRVASPPIAEAQGWANGDWAHGGPKDGRALLDVAQAVPGYPPPEPLRAHLAEAVARPEMHRYTDITGTPELRAALAQHMAGFYGGALSSEQVAITAGCNQAFCLATMALAGPGDEIMLPLPYYFNHQMWLEMQGIRPVHLPYAAARGGVPDPMEAARRITRRTRAIVLVTPNNPTGAVYPPDVVAAFFDLARAQGIALIVDETYKDFLDHEGAPHGLFVHPLWSDTLIQLYSFSKAYSLTGHRVGSIAADRAFLEQVAKAADCVAICPSALGQEAALFGLRHMDVWREENRRLMAARVAALRSAFENGRLRYELVSAGAYFAYVRHPFTGYTAWYVAEMLARRYKVLTLPGEMFGPGQEGHLRLAFANLPAETFPDLVERLIESQGDTP